MGGDPSDDDESSSSTSGDEPDDPGDASGATDGEKKKKRKKKYRAKGGRHHRKSKAIATSKIVGNLLEFTGKDLNEFAESFGRFLSTAPRDFPLIWRCKELMGPGMTTSSVWKPSGYNHAGGRSTVLCDHQTNQS